MYLCMDCCHVFDEPVYKPPTRFDGYSELRLCPHCGRSDITYAAHCERCGEVFPEDDLSYGICQKCEDEVEGAYAEYNPYRGVMNIFDIPMRMMGREL